MTLIHNITDLSVIAYLGDKRLHEFRVRWSLVTETMSDVISEDTLATILLQKLEGTVALREDISYYHRMPLDHPDRSYKLLRNVIDRRVTLQIQRKSRQEQTAALKRGPDFNASPKNAAPAADNASAPRNTGKGRGGGRSRRGRGSRSGSPAGGGQGGKTGGKAKNTTLCYFFNNGGCTRDRCPFVRNHAS